MNQPFNVVHELYRLVCLKSFAQRDEERAKAEEKKREQEEKRRRHDEAIREATPGFAAEDRIFGPSHDDKPNPPEQKTTPKESKSNLNLSKEDQIILNQMQSNATEQFLEGVLT